LDLSKQNLGRIDGDYSILEAGYESTCKVTVVSLEAVRALTVAEDHGIKLRNCPTYVRKWISGGRERPDILELFHEDAEIYFLNSDLDLDGSRS
jgi:hypothetical protein